MKTKNYLFSITILFFTTFSYSQTLYDVVLGTDNKPITEVQIEFNGSTITQTSGFGDVNIPSSKQTTLPVWMNYVKINHGGFKTLDFFNSLGSFVTNSNMTSANGGIGVYNEGTEILTSPSISAWEDAMQDMVNSRNALNYLFYDGSSSNPATPPAGDDFDILWKKALTNDDYLVVSERDGNTFFTIVPLGINGNPITSARALRFGFVDGVSSGNGSKKYDWNIGYGSDGRFETQGQMFSVVDVNLFNTSQPIYGFRIDNNGQADVKFYGLSDNTFRDNPTNPLVPGLQGNVFNDLDLLNDNTVDGSGISTPGGIQLYASLLSTTNAVLATVPIESDGSYEFLDNVDENTDYKVVIHTNPGGSSTPNLPTNWINTGENVGTSAGNDGSVNGIISASVLTTLVTEVNFGIVEQLPVGSIGDTVWYDADGNGSQNGSEGGLEGATVTLDPGTPGNSADDTTVLTDANGNYNFPNLPAGNYTVSVDVSTVTGGLPTGVTVAELSQTFDNDGTGTANTSDVTLAAGENNVAQDFGYQGLGSIGDTVWYDADGNGSQNGSEGGLEGATVTLDPGTPGNSADDTTVLTDANGNYNFPNLPAGNYTVSVDVSTVTGGLPTGVTVAELSQTFDNDGIGTANTSDVTLAAGENNVAQDFGYQGLGSIGDTVWYDADGNGSQNGSEGGLEGATVTLDPGTPGNSADDTTVLTDANGNYNFPNLPAGNYTVSVDVSTVTGGLPTGVTVAELSQTFDNDGTGTANTSDVTLAAGENNVAQDFGYQGLGSIGDTVWYDADGNGSQNGSEGGLEGATVTLDPGTPGNPADDVTTTTDANGNYNFPNLPAGNYTVSVDVSTVTGGLPTGVTVAELSQTFDNDGTGTANTSDVTLAAGENNVDQDFGYQGLGSIGDRVWYDATFTGDQGATEPGLEGATVTLDPGTPGNAADDVTTITDANGNYLFDNLPAGDYTITVDVSTVTGGLPGGASPADLSPVYDFDSVVTPNKSNYTLAAGESFLDLDFGYRALGSIGDTVWYDADGDGTQDVGEPGLEGATVTLDPGTPGNSADDVTTTTDANGNYTFPNLPAGNYTVSVDVSTVTGGLPTGVTVAELSQTFDNDGTGTANTSDVTLAAGENNVDQDFAYVSACRVGATVGVVTANDPDADGINNDCDLDDDNDGILDTEECEVVIGETPFAVSNGNSVNFTLAPVGNGFILDVTKMDNSFNLTINGTPLTTQEIQFQQQSTPTGQNIRFKDGSKWGQGGIPQIYQFGNNISQATPIVRFVIDANLNVTMYASKVANGPLFELELFNGNTFNTFTWNANASNNFVLSQIVTGATYINGRVYGTSLNCDIDEDGIRNSEDLDSDGDGCFDVVESGGVDANNDGILDGTSIDNTGKVVGGSGGYNGLNGNEWYAHQLSIVNAPLDLSKTDGDSATFSVIASAEEATGYNNGIPIYATAGNANSGIIYKWYLGDPNNGGVLLTDNGVYSNTNSENLTISDVTGLDGNMYYVVVTHTDKACAKETKFAQLTVNPLGSIGDTVWYDTDGDGILDSGEPGLEGATVTLDPGTSGDPSDDITTTTDSNGNYLFNNLSAGDYIITVSLSTVTNGVPSGKTVADLVQIFDADGLGSPSKSYVQLALGETNLDQDFAYIVPTGGTTGGNGGGVESESLGDAISKIYVGRKKNSVPTEFVKDASNLYNKSDLQAKQPYQGKGQTMLDMFPTELYAGNVANITSPTDILDYTIADEVLSVDFSLNGETKGVVLGIKTSDKVYNHTKASCDRLRGAEILNVQKIRIDGYNFLMQALKQRSGEIEFAVSFAASKNNNDNNYNIQTNWYVNEYTKFNDMYNFQVWSTRPSDTQKLVSDILMNLQSFIPVRQEEKEKFPKTYASKIYRDKGELVVNLRSTQEGQTADISMVELYSETANNIKHRYNTLDTEIQQALRVDIADGYEYDALIEVEQQVQDAFYHADGNWGLDFDKRYTKIQNYFVWNNFNREYVDDEYTINRNVEVKAESDYDYLTIYKSLLPGTISADYREYKYLAFTAKGSGLIELGLVKSSIQDWKQQYRIMVDLSEEEQTYYVPFEAFSSVGTQETIVADDLTTLTFTFLPVEANTTKLDLFISDVKFTKTAVEELIVNKIEKFENEFVAYPNPSRGDVNLLLFSKVDTEATITLTDITGKTIYSGNTMLTTGKNEVTRTFNSLRTGIYLLKVASKEADYGTSKLIIRQ